ncbi:related to GNAT family acetyltransferase [Phialocephala subalpina]|uniref:Related to GNAT family acetyltransferase n=1 Tax=Phialocephala subalpina TaxID=576137 RepID=A0A1L7WIS3_9HELO|nr:related to GNAT family acetyltransferase [Phialocephala subalpina]
MSDGPFHYEQRRLENDLVILEPFDPSVHIAPIVEVIKNNPEILTYISLPTIETEEDFKDFYDRDIRASPEECLYAIVDKVAVPEEEKSNGRYAGIMSLTVKNPVNAVIDMGAIIFPAFQHTHVATNAIGVLLLYTLDPPSAGGLGLRRVEWKCHAENVASRKAALRMGFELEGIARWERVFPHGKVGLPVDALEKWNGTKGELPGRHTAIFSIVWDEWEEKRPNVIAQIERKQ